MSAADLHRFLVVCALVSDLYCPGYNPRQPLAKDSNLARTAARYKVDTTKIATTVRTELSKPGTKPRDLTKPPEKRAKAATQQRKAELRKRSN